MNMTKYLGYIVAQVLGGAAALQFNNKVFVFGKLRDIEKAAYLAENERLKGIAGASVDVIDTFMDLNPPDGENKKEKLGEG